MDPDGAGAALQRLDEAMDRDHPYRDPDLTLAALAARAGIAPHALSQILNQQRATTFSQYVNRRRALDARQRLADPANVWLTIEAMARDSGFSSRSTFYKAFRDLEGATPVQFRARISGLRDSTS